MSRIINDYEELKQRLGSECAGKVIVCTIGSWDILHSGHIDYLREAREQGDILVVGVDSDDALLRYKKRKAHYPQADRQEIIAAIRTVDFVTVVEDVDASGEWQMGLVKAIKPEVFVCNDRTYPQAQRRRLQELCSIRTVAFHDASSISSVAALEDIKRTLHSVSQRLAEIDAGVKRSGENNAPALPVRGNKVFIGHGRSGAWREIKDFVQERINLVWDEFNRESAAGVSTKERLEEMLSNSAFALLVMTADDEHDDGSRHARENVIHEAGLFQGRVGFNRAIILLEDGCTEFSNVQGLGQIRFPRNKIGAAFEDIRRVLEREGLLRAIHG